MTDLLRAAGNPRTHLSPEEDAELGRRLAEEAAIDAQRVPEKVPAFSEEPYESVDGPRFGSTFVQRIEDGLE